jgi:hypothetical protein
MRSKACSTCEHVKECVGRTAYWAHGLRYKGGETCNQAVIWNVGTCRSDGKRKSQAAKRKRESIDAEHRGGSARSSVEVSVMEMERRSRHIR